MSKFIATISLVIDDTDMPHGFLVAEEDKNKYWKHQVELKLGSWPYVTYRNTIIESATEDMIRELLERNSRVS